MSERVKRIILDCGNLQSENFGLDFRVGHENTYHGFPYPGRSGEPSLNRVVLDGHNDGKWPVTHYRDAGCSWEKLQQQLLQSSEVEEDRTSP